ncbi:MAG: hypothetical protein CL881_05440 [Dehalococcoidia bacterium]|nr:hypothetical protein [Dehalococcoidia bacterium]
MLFDRAGSINRLSGLQNKGRKFPKIHAFRTTRILGGLARNFGKFQGSLGLQIAEQVYMVLRRQITKQRTIVIRRLRDTWVEWTDGSSRTERRLGRNEARWAAKDKRKRRRYKPPLDTSTARRRTMGTTLTKEDD